MKNEVNRAFVAKKKHVLTFILAASLPLMVMAYESPITEPGADSPTDMYTTTTTGPNHAPGGPNRAAMEEGITGNFDDSPEGGNQGGSPIGAPWILLGFAAAYVGYRLVRRKGAED